MNQINNEQKTAAIKTLAILGFVFVIVFGVWLAVQVVRILPEAFSSLASIADSVNSNKPTTALEIESEERVINSNQSFHLEWADLKREGFYTFSYVCAEGISVDVRFENGDIQNVKCDGGLVIEPGIKAIDVFVSSEKQRFTDVAYTLAFTEKGTTEFLFERNGKITVVNARIPVAGTVLGTDTEAPATTPEVVAVTPAVTTPVVTTPKPTTPVVPAKPQTITKTITYNPISNPNGVTDIRVSVIAVGTLENDVFKKDSTVDSDDRAAIQIEVKNFGTKTSKSWDFKIELPNGTDYTLNDEAGLKPNERSIITVGFEGDELDGKETFEGKVTLDGDKSTSDNSFKGTITFTN